MCTKEWPKSVNPVSFLAEKVFAFELSGVEDNNGGAFDVFWLNSLSDNVPQPEISRLKMAKTKMDFNVCLVFILPLSFVLV